MPFFILFFFFPYKSRHSIWTLPLLFFLSLPSSSGPFPLSLSLSLSLYIYIYIYLLFYIFINAIHGVLFLCTFLGSGVVRFLLKGFVYWKALY